MMPTAEIDKAVASLSAPSAESERLGARDGASMAKSTNRRPMVLHVRVVTGRGGGPEKTILNSPRFLGPLGYDSKIAYLHPPGDPGFAEIAGRGEALGAEVLSIPDRGPLDLSVLRRLLRICRQQRVAIWHGHDYKSNFLGLVLRYVWPMQLITTLHGWTNLSGRIPLYAKLDKWCLKYYRAAICVSEDLVEECARCRVPADRRHLIHNAIDTDDYRRSQPPAAAKQRLGLPTDGVLIGAVGRLSFEKRFDLLIQAVAELRQAGARVSLAIAGEGSERPALEECIRAVQGEDHIRLLGHVADPRLLYEAMDIYALSSIREGLPNVVLEAMALETPVVATRIAALPTMIADGRDGLLVAPENVEELKAALGRLIHDQPLRRQIAAAARQTIETRFSFARRMEKIAALYDRVLAGTAARRESAASIGSLEERR